MIASAPPQLRLLGGWRDILDDIRRLSRSLTAMPDRCECGNAAGHLNGSCACCRAAEPGSGGPIEDCTTLLDACEARIDMLLVDTLRFFPALAFALDSIHVPAAQTLGDQLQSEIAALVRTFQESKTAADAFRHGGEACDVPALKRAASELQLHAERLEQLLKGTVSVRP